MIKKNILVIEDDNSYRTIITSALKNAGYGVLEAANGEEGIRIFEQEPATLVITDIFMPEKEGFETILELKEIYPEVKILAISGGGKSGFIEVLPMSVDMGAEDILEKPFHIAALLEKVASIME